MVGMELREKVSTYVKERIGKSWTRYRLKLYGPCPSLEGL